MKTEPSKLPPAHAANLFGADVFGQWGGVPWDKAVSTDDNFWGLSGKIQVFPNNAALAGATDLDTDTDGPGGSTAVDPCWQGQTSLRYPDGSSCDSRQFPGLVIPSGRGGVTPPFARFGLRVGDFGYVSYNGLYMAVQVYDYGPWNKIGEGAERIGRGLGIIPPDRSSHRAADGGYPSVRDLFMLLFPGTRPAVEDPNKQRWCAVSQPEIEARARAAFEKLTARSVAVA
jgi:hypothetical protein